MENVELAVNNRTKKLVDKAEVKKLKLTIDKQVYSLILNCID